MSSPTGAYPLAWPMGWPRTAPAKRRAAQFGTSQTHYATDGTSSWKKKRELTIADGTARVLKVLEQMGFARSVIISSDLQLRGDGLPRSNQRAPEDPGVAVYWGQGKNARCMAVDHYLRVADNLGAIAATLEAMRAIERHGGSAILDRAFTGFAALPAPEQPWQVLGLATSSPSADQVNEAWRKLAAKHHPDRGGDAQLMARINAARSALLQGAGGFA